MKKLRSVLVLHGVVEEVVPGVELDIHVDAGQRESNDGDEQQSRGHPLFGEPIRFEQRPEVTPEARSDLAHADAPVDIVLAPVRVRSWRRLVPSPWGAHTV